ncbi:MAG: SRPBCC family protein [Hyphomicrobiaceae bacterium]
MQWGLVELKHNFEVPTGLEEAWNFFLDIPRVASCLPGAELTDVVDERHFEGSARVKVGPVALAFAGTAEIVEINAARHYAVVRAKGKDRKGRGNADATVQFELVPKDAGSTAVNVSTNLTLAGSVAQYGRASGLIDAVAQEIIADFVANLEADLKSDASQVEPAKSAAATQAAPPTAPRENEISGIALFWRALLRMVRNLLAPVGK